MRLPGGLSEVKRLLRNITLQAGWTLLIAIVVAGLTTSAMLNGPGLVYAQDGGSDQERSPRGGDGGAPSPLVNITGLVSTLEKGDSDSFKVEVSNLWGSGPYQLRISRPSGNSAIGFESTCLDSTVTQDIPVGVSRYDRVFTLYGCNTTGGTVTVELLSDGSQVDSRSQSVTVKDPQISFSGLTSSLDEGESDSFRVRASSLVATNSYEMRVTTSDSDLGFNNSCSDRQEEITVTTSSTSYTSSLLRLYGCETDGGTVTATLLRGGTEIRSASTTVNVESTASTYPNLTITASTSTVSEGQSITFAVTADSAQSTALIVNVSVTQNGSFISGTATTSVTISAGQTTTTFTVQTNDDSYVESDGSIEGQIESGAGYNRGSPYSVSVTVQDNDDPATWITTLTSAYDSQSNEFGYWKGVYGTLSPQAFRYDGAVYTVEYISWHATSRKIEFGVRGCLKVSDFVSLSIGSSTYSNVSTSRNTDAQCDADGAQLQEFEFHNVNSNPMMQGSNYEIEIALARDAITPVATAEPATQELFIGQPATLTASTSADFGTVSSYQWQKWSSGQWTDLASATSASYVVTSSTAGIGTFRLAVTNTSTTTAISSPASILWKPITVAVTASPEYPESGDATKRTVTLTASADAPTGVTYRWQRDSGSNWTNLGVSSTSPTKTVSYTTRGTRKFRVQVSHTVVPSVESEPVYVTWDEFAIVRDLLNALNASTTADTSYITAQTALVSCMNDNRASTSTPTYTSFSDILSRYAGDTKTTIEEDCSATSTTMFNTNETVSRSKLSALKSGPSATSTLYAALLESPRGRDFEGELADPDALKLVSYLGANVADPGSLQRPVYKSSGAGGQSDTLPPGVTLEQGAGLRCLPDGIEKDRLTLNNKLRVLNCLVFATPHSFWVKGNGARAADLLKGMIDSSTGQYNWLDRGDWECTVSSDGPLPSCLKHDVAYGGLQKIAGADTDVADGTELDEAWNPRNKALADYKFKSDITRWGCQDQTLIARALCLVPSSGIAQFPYFWAVAKRNHKGWPVTERDVADFTARPSFINCAEPVVPQVRDVAFSRQGNRLAITGEYVSGCVTVDLSEVDLAIEWDVLGFPSQHPPTTRCTVSGNTLSCYADLSYMPSGSMVTGVSVYVIPRDRTYGGSDYGGEGDTGRRSTLILNEFIS